MDEPILSSKLWLDPTQMGEAKILVEVKFDKLFPQKIALEDESGTITMVDMVGYPLNVVIMAIWVTKQHTA